MVVATVFGTFMLNTEQIIATGKYKEEQKEDDLEKKIEKAIEKFLIEKRVKYTKDLTPEEAKALAKIVQAIKNSENSAKAIVLLPIEGGGGGWAYYGAIFVTGDSSTGGFPHGHAGVGGYDKNYVIESDLKTGVKKHKDRVANYWSKHNASILYVKNATTAQFKKAAKYADDQVGKPYGLNNSTSSFYCSQLPHEAWRYAGITMYNTSGLGWLVLPIDLYNSSKTVVVAKYKNGY